MDINYLNRLHTATKNTVINEKFNFSNFESINAYLIRKTILKKFNLWINVNKRDLDGFYRPVVYTLLVEFFKRNLANVDKLTPNLGDKYHKQNKRFEVIKTGFKLGGRDAVQLECISHGHNEKVSLYIDSLYEDDNEYIKIDEDSGSSNRATFKQMTNLIKKAIGTNHNFSTFQNKFAIVCSKSHFEGSFTSKEREAFPYEYITKNGETVPNLPLTDFLFYVAPDYETIEEFVIDDGIDLDAVIFFGNKEVPQIQQDINRGSIKQVIYVGDQKLDINKLLTWKWTAPELKYFDEDTRKTKISPIRIENEELETITDKFIYYVQDIEDKYSINLRSIYLYISYIFPIVIPSADSRLSNRILELDYFFKKKLKPVLVQEFSVIGIDHNQAYVELLAIYRDALSQVEYANNSKFEQLNQLINHSSNSKMKEVNYLLVPPRQTIDVWKHEVRKMNWHNTKVISISKLREIKKQSSVTVLALEDKDFFQEIYGGIHNVKWLLYENEYKKYTGFKNKYNNELIAEFQSQDRKRLSGIDYPEVSTTETAEDLIDRIFDKDFIDDSNRGYETSYHDHIFKEITFVDDKSITLSANSSVILINQHNKAVNNRVGDLRVDDKVRIYENQHKDILFDSIVQSDKQGKFQQILEDSEKWKEILREYCTNDIKVNEIANECGIASSTVEGWLKPDSSTMFPQSLGKLKDLLGQDFFKIYKSNKIYKSIMIAAGRDLSDEISDFIINKSKGSFLSELGHEIINTLSEHNMPIRKIKSIEIVESELY